MNREPAGTYAVETKIQKTEGAEAGTQTQSVPAEIPAVTLETGYIPEGMIQTEEGKYSYSDTPSIGGISIVPVSYTHLDVYKRQGLWISSPIRLSRCGTVQA